MDIGIAAAPGGRLGDFTHLMIPRIQRALNEHKAAGLRTPETPVVFGWTSDPGVHNMLNYTGRFDSPVRAENLGLAFTRLGLMLPNTTPIDAEALILAGKDAPTHVREMYPDEELRFMIGQYGRRLFDRTLMSLVETGAFTYHAIDLEAIATGLDPHEVVEISAQLDSKLATLVSEREPISARVPARVTEAPHAYLDEMHELVFAYGMDELVSYGRRLTVTNTLSDRPLELNRAMYLDIIDELRAEFVRAAVRIPGTLYSIGTDGSIDPVIEHEMNDAVLEHLDALESELQNFTDGVERAVSAALRDHPKRFAIADDTATSGLEYLRIIAGRSG